MRIILFTGKGGVGKTTIAAATAIRSASLGYKTLVISTDPAHSLSDALDTTLKPEPTEVSENLFAQEFDVYYSMRKYWDNMRQLMLTVFRWQGIHHVMAEEMSALPGMEEASAFLWIEKYYEEKEYDVLVIDSAPTGETLTLLTLPQVTKWWVTKAFPLQKFAIKNVGKVARYTTGIPVDKGYEELENIFTKLENIQKVFSDPDITSIRLVANPEKMVINESKRAFTYLNLYGYNVDAFLINRVIEKQEVGSFFYDYYTKQQQYLLDIDDIFYDIPKFKVPHLGYEVFGIESLRKIAVQAYQEKDPTHVFNVKSNFEIKEENSGYTIRIKLPFLHESEYEVHKFGDELVIQLGNRRKNLFLPKFVNFYQLSSYFDDGDWLHIKLVK